MARNKSKQIGGPKRHLENQPSFEPLAGAEYVVDEKFRRVKPYYFEYRTNAKERWRDRNILDVFVTEFRSHTDDYYKMTIEKGLILVNEKPAALDTIVKNGDVITHKVHRHEPAVTSKPIGIIYKDEDLLVIDKPAGVPVHPAGRYRHNSVIHILRVDYGIDVVAPCNRLDRLTSGIMFLAMSRKGAEDMTKQLVERTIKKEYVCKVYGEFPDGEIVCDQPILTVSAKLSLNRVKPDGRDSKTIFQRLRYDPATNMSIVHAKPLSGRTHQIRVHLQWLGYPIANDPIYANPRVWGPEFGKGGAGDDEEIKAKLHLMGRGEPADTIAWKAARKEGEEPTGEVLDGSLCEICEVPLYSDPAEHEMGLWLHAFKYAAEDGSWGWHTEVPDWAKEFGVLKIGKDSEEAGVASEVVEAKQAVGVEEQPEAKRLKTDSDAPKSLWDKFCNFFR
ncbi:pseudouridine synthase [Saitoella complicata NRRL Y-17804]|uniref:pseudouridine synthase n=1 Tax=Saitoella complicata (strain BCRC 22490 / CBS 7301 / JCM 7358 / NBRC 10748 / NRRL Y-17804) TaxID=698492 RepID=UPI000867683D|nr:pseudouridine synthase [Saitoella complicata NRRL Y-17804]ODQ55876.1 pseudouridine synthase [Saitoella complicata NRRL Y-17804]